MEVGLPEELDCLPAGRHSSCFVAGKVLTVRWRYRKNMPGGSVLQRECKCKDECIPTCVVGRMEKCLEGKLTGERVFTASDCQTLNTIRRVLRLLQVPMPETCIWRAIRRGVATEMASKGCGGKLLQEQGQWQSETGFMPYVDFDRVDEEEQQRLDLHTSSEEESEDT